MCQTLDDDLSWLADRAGLHEPVSRAAWISAAKEIFERYKPAPITSARILLSEINERTKTIEGLLRHDPMQARLAPYRGGAWYDRG